MQHKNLDGVHIFHEPLAVVGQEKKVGSRLISDLSANNTLAPGRQLQAEMEQLPVIGGMAIGGLLVAQLLVAAIQAHNKEAAELKGSRKVLSLPSTLPFLSNTLDLITNLPRMHDWHVDNCLKLQGEPYLIRALGQIDIVAVTTPQAVEDVLKNQFAAFPKGERFCDVVRDLFGNGIFGVDDDKWVHQRKVASRLFTQKTMRDSMTACIQKHAVTLLDVLETHADGKSIDLFNLLNRFTMEAFAEIGFGIHMNCIDIEKDHPFQTAFDGAQRILALRFTRPTWFWKIQRWLDVGAEAEFRRHIGIIDSTVLEIVMKSIARYNSAAPTDDQEKEIAPYKDLVTLFLDSIDDEQRFTTDPMFLRDMAVNFLVAGRDTTAQALSWFFYNVALHPEVETKIVTEIQEKLPAMMGEISQSTRTSMQEVGELVYLEAALRETLRLYPSVPCEQKTTAYDVVLSDGTFVAKDTVLGIPFYAMGRVPYVWGEDAAEFKPERWIDSETCRVKAEPASKFVAFNAGPRTCLGKNLALLEMKIVAATVLSKYHLTIIEPEQVTYAFSLTLPMKGGLPVRVSTRSKAMHS